MSALLPSALEAPLGFAPLPPPAFKAARDGLEGCGFARESILIDYGFSTQVRRHVRVNALAFAHPVHRTPGDYAGISLYNAVDGASDPAIVAVLAQSSAPFHLIHRDGAFSLWASAVERDAVQPLPLATGVAYDQLDHALGEYGADLQPHRIVEVKRGHEGFMHPRLRDVRPRQLALWALEITRPLLVQHFGEAVRTLRSGGIPDDQIAAIATQLLGAVILADTGVLGEGIRPWTNTGYHELLGRAEANFPEYFGDALQRWSDAVQHAYAVLRQISYAGFEPDMLTELYTAAYSAEKRKALGRYDTPLYLTRRIWEAIPVEQLPPERRVVADMTCGWGSFLIAAYERLSDLVDMQGRRLRDDLHGNDLDRLTAQLARLGLLLATSADSWQIDHGETSSWRWLAEHRPDIIVGNPPFGGARSRPVPGMTTRYQKADQFLALAIDRLAPDGYLAMVMPHSFVAAQSAPGLRRQLLKACDILELWDLPYNVFPDATVATTVVFARKRGAVGTALHAPVRVRTLQARTRDWFKASGAFTASTIVHDQAIWAEPPQRVGENGSRRESRYVMDFYTVLTETAWERIHAVSVPLGRIVQYTQGTTKGESSKLWPVPSKPVRWLRGPASPFVVDYESAEMVSYPDDFVRPRLEKEHLLAGPKVLLARIQNDSWGRRAHVAIERHRYYPSDNFWVLVPRPEVDLPHITQLSHEVVAAVAGWYVSNAWIVEHLKSPQVPKRALLTIPFPRDLTERDCATLEEAVLAFEAAAAAGQPLPTVARDAIDHTLRAAYQLDDDAYRRVRTVAEWGDRADLISLDPQPEVARAEWAVSGVVTGMDLDNDAITVWLEGLDRPQATRVTPAMPGWMLRPDAAFQTAIPREVARRGRLDPQELLPGAFRPQPYTYLDEQALLDALALALQADTTERGGRQAP